MISSILGFLFGLGCGILGLTIYKRIVDYKESNSENHFED